MTQEKTIFDELQALELRDAGWRQGSFFKPNKHFPCENNGAYWVICTHSCTLMSKCLIKAPYVEVIIGKRVEKYKPKSPEARGKDNGKYHLPVSGQAFECLEIDINSRRFFERQLLLETTLETLIISNEARKNFAGWISRLYSRITLPDTLVKRLKPEVLKKLERILKTKLNENNTQKSDEIKSIWIKFTPNIEIEDHLNYEISLFFICDNPIMVEKFDKELQTLSGSYHGLDIKIDVNSPNEILLSDLDEYYRFSEWDFFSYLGEIADMSEKS
jgi:hypothetical protein